MSEPKLNSPMPRGVFHGWIMLGIAICMAFATMPAQTVLVSLWKEPLRESLGLSLAQVSGAYSLGTIIASLPLSFVGRVADRFGLRLTVFVVTIAFALSLALLREATGIVTLGIGFFFVRFLGQGSLGMLSGHTIAMWFERRLGAVHAMLTVCGYAAAGALLQQPTAWMLANIGWRSTLLAFAAMVMVLVLPGVIFLFRNKPEDIGQHLDGDVHEHVKHDVLHGGPPPLGDPAFTVRHAVRTPAYWILLFNTLATGFVGTALLFHMPALLQQSGLEGTEQQAALANQAWPLSFGAAMIGMSLIVDRLHPRRILPLSVLVMAAAMAMCLAAARGMVSEAWTIPLMATGMGVYGASQAGIVAVANPTVARYFGRTHHGAIRGTIATATVMGTGGGPYLFALGYDLAGGDFTWVFVVCLALCVPLGIGAAMLRRPEPPRDRDLTPDPDMVDPPGPLQ